MAKILDVMPGRSPRYPRVSLEIALKHARTIYEAAHRSVLSPDTAYYAMGFNGKTGASATALGALRQFGLVEGLRGDLRISELALQILQPSSLEERVHAIHEAANTPEAFGEIIDNFDGNIPKSDDVIRAFLIRNLDFSKNGAEDCIASFRATFEFTDQEWQQIDSQSEAVDTKNLTPNFPQKVQEVDESSALPVQNKNRLNESEFARIPLTRDCVAELQIEGKITRAALSRLIQHIELMKDIWTDDSE